jgi:tRNA wybutosine-synthesizing protein 4
MKTSDPLPFQFWHRYTSACQNATFVDVDYPQLIERKRDRMLRNGLLRDALFKTNLRSASTPVYLRSDNYAAIGCDLRELDALKKLLEAEFDLQASSILFVAEVSVTYMPLQDANALIAWASKFPDCMCSPILLFANYSLTITQLGSACWNSICHKGQTTPLQRPC